MPNPITEFFEHDHQRLDNLFKEFQQNQLVIDKATPLFHSFKQGLLRHIEWEEELLFPAVEVAAGLLPNMGQTHVMRMEHFQIKECLELIETKLADQADSTLVQDRLLDILAEHNIKEERVLYPMSDDSIPEYEAKRIINQCLGTQTS